MGFPLSVLGAGTPLQEAPAAPPASEFTCGETVSQQEDGNDRSPDLRRRHFRSELVTEESLFPASSQTNLPVRLSSRPDLAAPGVGASSPCCRGPGRARGTWTTARGQHGVCRRKHRGADGAVYRAGSVPGLRRVLGATGVQSAVTGVTNPPDGWGWPKPQTLIPSLSHVLEAGL